MQLLIVRHGESPPAPQSGVASDAERSLSEKGRQDITTLANKLRRDDLKPELILSSPLRRAWETAGIVAAVFSPPTPLKKLPALASGASPTELAKAIEWEISDKNYRFIVLTGHQPQLGAFISWLTQSPAPPLAPGSCAAVEYRGPHVSQFLWVHHP
ncbi:MAG: histidine phosphatase family protein [Elusimicrobia bacterium]|nr:histidine phosphatase family protein [Elusimicrobiota bacterium]